MDLLDSCEKRKKSHMDVLRRDFDAAAATWDEEPRRVQLANDVFAAMEKRLVFDKGMRALDFGCGTGLLTLRLAPLVSSVTGADASAGMLRKLEEKLTAAAIDNVRTLWVDPDGSSSMGGPYDLIASCMTLHHIEDVDGLLGTFYRSLAPGGSLCIADLDPDDGLFHGAAADVRHNGFERASLRRRFAEAGFADIDDVSAAEVVKPDSEGELRRFTIFLMTGRRGEMEVR